LIAIPVFQDATIVIGEMSAFLAAVAVMIAAVLIAPEESSGAYVRGSILSGRIR